jgi:regulator of replication initiation timing
MTVGIILRHLAFTGAGKKTAQLEFGEKLNLIWGASNTGKSYTLKALDFMFGGSNTPPDINESHGYDTVWLGLTLPKRGDVTLSRAIRGGAFLIHEGLVTKEDEIQTVTTLQPKHNANSDGNLSAFLLDKLELSGKYVATNTYGENRPLSFRDLGLFFLVDETSIQIERSPIEGGQRNDRTGEHSVFRLLLTGVDDSKLAPLEDPKKFNAAKRVRLEVLDNLIADINVTLKSEYPDVSGLENQKKRLENTIENTSATFEQLQSSIRLLIAEKQQLARLIPETGSRLDEVSLHIDRFEQLQEVYTSDLQRLEALEEAGFLLSVAAKQNCPLCGAPPDAQVHAHDHEEITNVREAALVEIGKISRQSEDLKFALVDLNSEQLALRAELPKLSARLAKLEGEISALAPHASESQRALSGIIEARDKLNRGVAILEQRDDLARRRDEYQRAKAVSRSDRPDLSLPGGISHDFAQTVSEVLKLWGFPGEGHVSFDDDTYDLKIDGKPRVANGKGVRAVTHAAFKVALLLFCKKHGLPHPGFLVLDTPLLTYRDPLKNPRFGELEQDEKELAQTSLKDRFFRHLASLEGAAQFIILENVDPPVGFENDAIIELFSGGGTLGRKGLFPSASSIIDQ